VLKRLDLAKATTPVAVFVPWRGSATFRRLDDFCRGATGGLAEYSGERPSAGPGRGRRPVGGLLGIHLREEMRITNAIVSVDGLELRNSTYIDIGTMLPTSGAVRRHQVADLFRPAPRPARNGSRRARARQRRPPPRLRSERPDGALPRTVDTGGTFSDFVYLNEETREVTISKVPSKPDDPSRAILQGVETLLAKGVAAPISILLSRHHRRTNALLEGKGVKTGLLVTEGFRGIYPVGEQARPYGAAIFDGDVRQSPALLVPQSLTGEVKERVDHRGHVLCALDEAALLETFARARPLQSRVDRGLPAVLVSPSGA